MFGLLRLLSVQMFICCVVIALFVYIGTMLYIRFCQLAGNLQLSVYF
jgi:hypothetical protein